MTSVLKKKRYLMPLLASVSLALVILIPYILSSGPALHFFISSVNKRVPGKLSVGSWLVGWQQGVLCQDVVYIDAENGIDVAIPTLTSDRGLIELLLDPKNLGVVHADSPLVSLSGPAAQALFFKGRPLVAREGAAADPSAAGTPVWDQVYLTVKSRDGLVKVVQADRDVAIDISKVSVDSTLDSGIVSFSIGLAAPGQGFVDASGAINLPANTYGWLETVIVDTEIKISSLAVGDFLKAGATAVSLLPQGEGFLNADLQLKAVGVQNIEVSGIAELTDLVLSGGVLGNDHPTFKKIHLVMDEGRWAENSWTVKGLDLVSDTLDLKASGEAAHGSLDIEGRGTIDLPVLFDQVPRLLNVHESAFLETGVLDFSYGITSSGPDLRMKIKARAKDIGGIFEEQRFFWDSPAVLLFNGEKKGSAFHVNALQFDLPFAHGKGSGGLHSFEMDAELDLERAFADIGTLFKLDLSGSGRAELTLKSISDGEDLERFKATVDLSIQDFLLHRLDKSIIPTHQFSLIGDLKAPNTLFEEKGGELDLYMGLSSWVGELFLVVNGEKSAESPFKGYYTTDSEIELGPLTPVLHWFDILDGESRLAGTMQMQGAGFVWDSSVEIRDLSAEVTDFFLEGNGVIFNEPQISLQIHQPVNEDVPFLSVRELKILTDEEEFFLTGAGLNLIDVKNKNIFLHNVTLDGKAAMARVERLVTRDWEEPFDRARSQITFSADMGKISAALHALGLMPVDTDLSGSSQASIKLTGKGEAAQEMDVRVQVNDLTMQRRQKKIIDSENVVFSTSVQGMIPFGAMTVDAFKLRSDTLNIDTAGSISDMGEVQLLELKGTLTADLEKMATFIESEIEFDLEMKGRPEEEIVFRYPLWLAPRESVEHLHVSSSLHADSLAVDGLSLRKVSLPFNVAEGKLHLELSGILNSGAVNLAVDTDLLAEPPVVKTLAGNKVMTGVRLNRPLVAMLLSRVHPLFGGLTEPSGTVDVRLDSLWLPIGEKSKNEASFVVIFDVRGIQLQSREKMQSMLSVFGLGEEKLDLQDNEIYCICQNGHVKCSPVKLLAGEYEIVVGGSVSMDRSMEYELEVPVTGKLFNKEGYKVLEGEKVTVALKGTSLEPSFNREAIASAIQVLMQKAADEIMLDNGGKEVQ